LIRDEFQAFLIEGAQLSDNFEFPILYPCHEIPEKLISFSKISKVENINQFIHFYERDKDILSFYRNPRKFFPRISQFKGAIGCDISIYRNMPFAKQIDHTYNNRALTFWLQNHGLSVIPNVRYGDNRSYSFCFEGIPKKSVISIGTYGNMKMKDDIDCNTKGLVETIKQLKPEAIVFYGTIKEEMRSILSLEKIYYRIFDSFTSEFFKNRLDKTCPLFEGHNIGGA